MTINTLHAAQALRIAPLPSGSIVPRTQSDLHAALRDARDYTWSIYAHLDEEALRFPLLRVVNPPRWELGHVGWFQEYWCLRDGPRNAARKPSRYRGADELWNSSLVPHDTRWLLALPDWSELRNYLDATLEDTLEALVTGGAQDAYFFELALYHEDMHGEALLMTLQTLGLAAPPWLRARTIASAEARCAAQASGDLAIPAHEAEIGSTRADLAARFVFDNEKWAHRTRIDAFRIARRCVTNAEFHAFVEEDGYRRPELWSEQGRTWLATADRSAPAYWRREGLRGEWRQLRFGESVAMAWDAPVQHVNAYEAEAWCRWAGRRLPSEAEWEVAARYVEHCTADEGAREAPAANLDAGAWGPLAAQLDHCDAPLVHMIGNVWEWTASPFSPYPGFAPDPYADYSAPWFGTHRVLRGGSWATRARLAHSRFRNFYTPERHDPFVGFRTCAGQA